MYKWDIELELVGGICGEDEVKLFPIKRGSIEELRISIHYNLL